MKNLNDKNYNIMFSFFALLMLVGMVTCDGAGAAKGEWEPPSVDEPEHQLVFVFPRLLCTHAIICISTPNNFAH